MNPMLTNQNSGQGLQIEASRDMTLFNMNPINIVEILMDVVGFSVALFILFFFLLICVVQSRFNVTQAHGGNHY
jgi:hypothetical protein